MLKKLSDKEISDLKLAFKHFDKDGNERISLNELGSVMKTLLGQKLDNKRLQVRCLAIKGVHCAS